MLYFIKMSILVFVVSFPPGSALQQIKSTTRVNVQRAL